MKNNNKFIKTYSYAERFTYVDRYNEALRMLNKYPSRVPIICEKINDSNGPDIKNNKFLVPNDITVGQFMHVIRNQINLPKNEALFLFTNNIIPSNSLIIGTLYEQYKSNDLFLYMIYSYENTFG